MSEKEIQNAIRIAASRLPGVVLWRNNTGIAEHWNGSSVERVAYGLGKGSADLVGIVDGRFLALEVKAARGRVSPDQVQWLALVRAVGGYSAVVRSVDEAIAAIEAARRGEP